MALDLEARARPLTDLDYQGGPVVYWLSREQRHQDNFPLLLAQRTALAAQAPLAVVFTLAPAFLGATRRQYEFLLRGLAEVAEALSRYRIPFFLLRGEPPATLAAFLAENQAGLLVIDFDPLKIKRGWKEAVLHRHRLPAVEVDGHNIIPCWLASPKQEYGAYTLRPKLKRLLPDFLTEFPSLVPHPFPWLRPAPAWDWRQVLRELAPAEAGPPIRWCEPGEQAAHKALQIFLTERLAAYHRKRNNPAERGQSDLSPYLHFGHLAPQRLALEVSRAPVPAAAKEAFLEELIVRRELADNFCYYNPDYDQCGGFPPWAQRTLEKHRADPRPYLYRLEELEAGQTHDPLWNAAQLEMVYRGKMHGYLRMYWAKKLLEWTASPAEALRIAIYLNDRYELDGRDPNGYTGIAWSIGGVHDRPWQERPIFGQIRYMSAAGCQRKFPVAQYLAQVKSLVESVS